MAQTPDEPKAQVQTTGGHDQPAELTTRIGLTSDSRVVRPEQFEQGRVVIMGPGARSRTSEPRGESAERLKSWLQEENNSLRREVQQQAVQINAHAKADAEKDRLIAKHLATIEELDQNEKLAFLSNRVCREAEDLLGKSKAFRDLFLSTEESDAFVLSVDIRRSTELMLKAKSAKLFARFISELSHMLARAVTDNFGIFDKFTGDGILAFFPSFYSGPDAGHYAVSAAIQCHEIFHEHYCDFRNAFNLILEDTGLGIGIDYGPTHLLRIADGYTVVGTPVVYACRFSGTPAGTTLLNQGAYDRLREGAHAAFHFSEDVLTTKHEGRVRGYSVRSSGTQVTVRRPEWPTDPEGELGGHDERGRSPGD